MNKGMIAGLQNAENRETGALLKRSASLHLANMNGKRAPLAARQNKLHSLADNSKKDVTFVKEKHNPALQSTKPLNDENADVTQCLALNATTVVSNFTRSKVPIAEPPKKHAALSKIPRFSLIRINTVNDFGINGDDPAFSSYLLPPNVENIDANDTANVMLTPDYVNDIYGYLRHLEGVQFVKENFLSVQREMSPKMRSVLIDWLIQVHYQFRLLPETLYLGISIMDRFFQKEVISKDKIQLVGVTAFFIASKFEEIYPPDIKDFVIICDKLYHKRDILKMEIAILKTLKFELGRPLPLHFLRRYSKAAKADSTIHSMAKYLMELTLVEYECAHWHPSLLAATALYVTLQIIGESLEWTPTLEFYSIYTEEQLIQYATVLCKVIKRSEKSKFQNCRKKYESSKLMSVSKMPQLKSSIVDEIAAKS